MKKLLVIALLLVTGGMFAQKFEDMFEVPDTLPNGIVKIIPKYSAVFGSKTDTVALILRMEFDTSLQCVFVTGMYVGDKHDIQSNYRIIFRATEIPIGRLTYNYFIPDAKTSIFIMAQEVVGIRRGEDVLLPMGESKTYFQQYILGFTKIASDWR